VPSSTKGGSGDHPNTKKEKNDVQGTRRSKKGKKNKNARILEADSGGCGREGEDKKGVGNRYTRGKTISSGRVAREFHPNRKRWASPRERKKKEQVQEPSWTLRES